jgi:hypothetical protein
MHCAVPLALGTGALFNVYLWITQFLDQSQANSAHSRHMFETEKAVVGQRFALDLALFSVILC